MLKGIGVFDGIGIGQAYIYEENEIVVKKGRKLSKEEEKEAFLEAQETFEKEISDLIAKPTYELEKEQKEILLGQLTMIKDPELLSLIEAFISQENMSAAEAVERVCDQYIQVFLNSGDEVLCERATDVKDLKQRMLRILLGVAEKRLDQFPEETILVTKELTPSMTTRLDLSKICGIVTETGGRTSHVAILAKLLEIPAVLGVSQATTKIKTKNVVGINGKRGEVFVSPNETQLDILKKSQEECKQQQRELIAFKEKKAETKDRRPIFLGGNIVGAKDTKKLLEYGASGVGLFRTEFLYMDRSTFPDEEEQFLVYKETLEGMEKKSVTIRTLDVGGDKEIGYLGIEQEMNPFLGYRGIRYCLGEPFRFKQQLKAILRASAYGKAKIMLPMVTSLDEVNQTKKLLDECKEQLEELGVPYDKDIKLGIMMETPAACVIADQLAEEVDFFSIGTNDLTQYLLAVDRGNKKVSYLYSVFHPAVLRSIHRVIQCGKEAGITVSMCGEAASLPILIPVWLGFGLTEFSVSPSAILQTKKILRSCDSKECIEIANKVLAMKESGQVAQYLESKCKDYYEF